MPFLNLKFLNKKTLLLFSLILFFPILTLAETPNLQITEIYFKKAPVVNQPNRLYVIVKNNNLSQDYYGSVKADIMVNGKKLIFGETQIVSIYSNNTDGVFFDQTLPATEGNTEFTFSVFEPSLNLAQLTQTKIINIDGDNDGDGMGNTQDPDDDNDGLLDVDEIKYKTDPFNPDTDGDGIKDGQEILLGTNPLSKDTDKDGIPDKLDSQPTIPNNQNLAIKNNQNNNFNTVSDPNQNNSNNLLTTNLSNENSGLIVSDSNTGLLNLKTNNNLNQNNAPTNSLESNISLDLANQSDAINTILGSDNNKKLQNKSQGWLKIFWQNILLKFYWLWLTILYLLVMIIILLRKKIKNRKPSFKQLLKNTNDVDEDNNDTDFLNQNKKDFIIRKL